MRCAIVFVIFIFSLLGCGSGNKNIKPDIKYGNPYQKHPSLDRTGIGSILPGSDHLVAPGAAGEKEDQHKNQSR